MSICVFISSGVEMNGMITVFTWLCVMILVGGDVDWSVFEWCLVFLQHLHHLHLYLAFLCCLGWYSVQDKEYQYKCSKVVLGVANWSDHGSPWSAALVIISQSFFWLYLTRNFWQDLIVPVWKIEHYKYKSGWHVFLAEVEWLIETNRKITTSS